MPRLITSVLVLSSLVTPALADAPVRVAPALAGVGRMAPDLAGTDLSGKPVRLVELIRDQKAVVVTLTSPSCPVSARYLPAFARFEKDYMAKGVRFVYLNPTASDTPEAIRKAVAAAGVTGPYLHDPDGTLARALGAKTTSDVFVVDTRRTIVYRGAVDDRYGVGYAREEPRHTYLANALDALLAGRSVEVAATTAPGCVLDLSESKAAQNSAVTYHNRISRILQSACLDCHRSGGVGPFPLETHDDVIGHKGMIRKVVEKGIMPPWFAAAEKEHSRWINDRSLPIADRADLLTWLASGTPVGDPQDAPLPRTFPKDWVIGKPDLVVSIPKPIAVKAEGTMPYQTVVAETGLDEEKWVQAVEIRPTAKAVVHHVLVFTTTGEKRGRDAVRERDGFFAAYVPGNDHQIYPEGFAKKLPKGIKLAFQIHYTPNGTATEDQLAIALRFAKEPPRHELRVVGLANMKIEIPPGAADHADRAQIRLPFDAVITSFMPHMHLRGKACKYELITPDATKTILEVPKYDFNWQLRYELAEPIAVTRGSTLKYTARYDNSESNPANPDATRTVRWGPQTFDEMLLGYVEYYRPAK